MTVLILPEIAFKKEKKNLSVDRGMLSWKTDSGFKLVSFDGNAEGAAAGFRVGPGDGEAEAASLSGSGRAASDETFCDGFGVKVHIIGRGIDNGYGDEIGLLFGIQIDPGSGKRIFQGIVNQVLKDRCILFPSVRTIRGLSGIRRRMEKPEARIFSSMSPRVYSIRRPRSRSVSWRVILPLAAFDRSNRSSTIV